jgi:hypothetical protein
VSLIRSETLRFSILRTNEAVQCSTAALRHLAVKYAHLPDLTRFPEYFMAALTSRSKPCVVVGTEHDSVIGAVYGMESQVFRGVSGWVFVGDEMGRGAVVCAPEREEQFLRDACTHLLQNGIHAIRLRWKPAADLPFVAPGIEVPGATVADSVRLRPMGDSLPLSGNYEDLLNSFGSHTRRNLRYYRRKAERTGIRFVRDMSESEFDRAVTSLRHLTDFAHTSEREQRDRRFFKLAGEPILMALQTSSKLYAAVLAAVQFGSNVHVLSQLNDTLCGA